MKRTAGALVLLAAVGGCMTMDQGHSAGGLCGSCGGYSSGPPRVWGLQGPWGQPVAMVAPYSASPPGAEAARAMMAQSVPLELVQPGANTASGSPSGIMLAGGPAAANISPPNVPFQPIMPCGYPGGATASVGALTGPSAQAYASKRTEVRFVGPDKMNISWGGSTPDGRPAQGHIDVPGRYNFVQAAVYRLKMSGIPGLPGVELYPTLEVVPANARTETFLAHSSVPVSFTNEDFEQVQAGNYLVKVIYLPHPQFQDLAAAGPDEIISSRLEPGADPLAEAHRRGNILLVIRLGNINLELPNSPPMDAPNPFAPKHAMAQGMPGAGMVPGMPMPVLVGGRPNMGPTGQPTLMPDGPMLGTPLTQPASPVPAMPTTGQSVPLSQLPDAPMPQRRESKDSAVNWTVDSTQPAGQATEVIAEEMDTKPPPKRHWWWPWGGSDK
jgi:hypothetical protein